MKKSLKYYLLFLGTCWMQMSLAHHEMHQELNLTSPLNHIISLKKQNLTLHPIDLLNAKVDIKDSLNLTTKDPLEFSILNDISTNGNDGGVALENAGWSIEANWRIGYDIDHGSEVQTHVGKYFGPNQQWMPFIGYDWEIRELEVDEIDKNVFGQINHKNEWSAFTVGIEYMLPIKVVLQAKLYADGRFRLQAYRDDILITPKLRWDVMVDTDMDYMTRIKYYFTEYFGVTSHYDEGGGFGVGVILTY